MTPSLKSDDRPDPALMFILGIAVGAAAPLLLLAVT
jgi:hypothetical protein